MISDIFVKGDERCLKTRDKIDSNGCVFTWTVIVDLDSEPVTRDQVQELVNQASAILMELTGFSYAMVDFVESTSPGNVSDPAATYVYVL
jgi:hypothetical protein